jgi:hypothetical protein
VAMKKLELGHNQLFDRKWKIVLFDSLAGIVAITMIIILFIPAIVIINWNRYHEDPQ